MPRIFFHAEAKRRFHDSDGTELPDRQAARLEAMRILCQIIPTLADEILACGTLKLTVTDETGLVLFVFDLDFTEAPAERAFR